MRDESPLTERERAWITLAGWHLVGGSGTTPIRLYFRHDDGRHVERTRAEARAEVVRVQARWSALERVAKAARAMVQADRAWDAYIYDDGPDDDARVEALDDMANKARAELRAALAALEAYSES